MASCFVSFVVLLFFVSGIDARATNRRINRPKLVQDIRSRHFGLVLSRTMEAIRRRKLHQKVTDVISKLADHDAPVSQLDTLQLEYDLVEFGTAALNELAVEKCRDDVLAELLLGSVKYNIELEFNPSIPTNMFSFVRTWLNEGSADLHYVGSPESVATKYVEFVYGPVISPLEELSQELDVLTGEEEFFNKSMKMVHYLSSSTTILDDALGKILSNLDVLRVNTLHCSRRNMTEEFEKTLLEIDNYYEGYMQLEEEFRDMTNISYDQMDNLDSYLWDNLLLSPSYYTIFDMLEADTSRESMMEIFAHHVAEVYFGRPDISDYGSGSGEEDLYSTGTM